MSKRNSSFLETRTRMSEYLKANEELPEQEAAKESGVTSGLSEAMENTTQHDFLAVGNFAPNAFEHTSLFAGNSLNPSVR